MLIAAENNRRVAMTTEQWEVDPNSARRRLGNLWPQLNYHPIQYAMWTCPKRLVYAPCGRASGKTELACRRLVICTALEHDHDETPIYIFAGPTYAQAKRIAWHKLLKLIPRHWIDEISKAELTIRTVFGSELWLVGLDRPERIEGIQIDGIVVDENCDIKPGTFDLNVLPTLTWRSAWAWRIGVPKRFGPGAVEYRERFQAAAAGNDPDAAGFTWPSADIVPKELLEYARRTMNERDFAEQFEASWLSASGGVFHSFDRDYNVRPCSYSPGLPILVGSDFNVSPMAWSLCHRKGETIEVFDEIWLRNTNTLATLRVLTAKYKDHKGGFQMYGDATSRARRASAYSTDYNQLQHDKELVRMGRTIHYLHSNPPKADRFAVTNNRLCDGEKNRHVFIDPHCTHLINDLEIRTFKPGTREPADSGDIGHPSDSLGYLLYKLFPLSLRLASSKIISIVGAA